MGKHTKGPWVPVQGHEGVRFYASEHEEQFVWCEKSADARLISAAPELLACVKELIQFCPILDDDKAPQEYVRALAAIAKATGGAE
jgi:hypothetical protein